MKNLCFYLCVAAGIMFGIFLGLWYCKSEFSDVFFNVTIALMLGILVTLGFLTRDKSENNPDQEERDRIAGILNETRNEFRRGFMSMAYSDTKKDQRKFVAIYANLLEVVHGKPAKSLPFTEEELQDLQSKTKEGGEAC